MKQRYEEKILVTSNTTLYEALVQGMLAQGWDRVQTIINDRKKERYIYAIFRREIHGCDEPGCEEQATERHDFSFDLPDSGLCCAYGWRCAEHAPKPTLEPETVPEHTCCVESCDKPGEHEVKCWAFWEDMPSGYYCHYHYTGEPQPSDPTPAETEDAPVSTKPHEEERAVRAAEQSVHYLITDALRDGYDERIQRITDRLCDLLTDEAHYAETAVHCA